MINKKFGIDIDDVSGDFSTPLRQFYAEVFGKGKPAENYEGARLSEFWGVSEERVLEIIEGFYESEFFDKIRPMPGAKKALEKLSQDHELIAVTNRPTYLRARTEEWIANNYPGLFTKVLFNGNEHRDYSMSKARTCLNNGIGIFIDDDAGIVRNLHVEGVYGFLFDRPWNKQEEDLELVRIRGWGEALTKFNKAR